MTLNTRVLLVLFVFAAGCQSRPTPTPRLSPAPAAGEPLTGLRAALGTVPANVVPADGRGWTDAKIDVANRALATEAVGRPITLRLKVAEVIRWEKGHALNGPTAEIGDLADVDFWIYFPEPRALAAARLNLGDEVTVTGKLNAMRFSQPKDRPGVVHLYVEVDKAELPTQNASAEPTT